MVVVVVMMIVAVVGDVMVEDMTMCVLILKVKLERANDDRVV